MDQDFDLNSWIIDKQQYNDWASEEYQELDLDEEETL